MCFESYSAVLPWEGCKDSTADNTRGFDVTLYTSGNTTTLTPTKTSARFGNAFGETLVSHSLHQKPLTRKSDKIHGTHCNNN